MIRTQKGTLIWTTTHVIQGFSFWGFGALGLRVTGCGLKVKFKTEISS